MCFSLEWFKDLLIWIIAVCFVVAVLRVLVAFILPKMDVGAEVLVVVVKVLTLAMWAVICIALVVFAIDLIACILPSMPRLGR